MSSTTWWILALTVPIALIIMIVSFVTMRIKIENIKQLYLSQKVEEFHNDALENKDNGNLYWKEKEKYKNPTPDKTMSFIINTVIRNKYKTFKSFNFDYEYEKKSIIEKTQSEHCDMKYDFALVNFNPNRTLDNIIDIMEKTNNKSMVAIINIGSNSIKKDILSYFKLIGLRTEFIKIDKGIILIVK